MVRKASDKTLWGMSVNQIEDRIDRLQNEAKSIYPAVVKCRSKKHKSMAHCKVTNTRMDKIKKELKRTTDIAKITRHHAKLRAKKRRK